MSFLNENEDDEISNIYNKENISLSPISLNNKEDQDFLNNAEDDNYSRSSFILSEKSRPLFISNENFINYFMHIDYNTPLNRESIETLKNNMNMNNMNNMNINIKQNNSELPKNNINSTNENQNKNSFLSKKSKKEKEYGILTDSKTGITYNEEDDPINYRKAKKRIQNRESALRMKKMREKGNNQLEDEIIHLKEDNIRLINENISLKKEKEFLIEQIKFMQKIIKESNLEFKLKNEINDGGIDNNSISVSNSSSSNDETKKEPIFYYNGSKQKIKGKLFNVFIICTLSLIYIIGECSLNGDKNNNQNMGVRSQRSIHLNSIKEKEGNLMKNTIWFYFSKIILVVIFLMIIPLFKEIGNFFEMIIKRNKKNKYY
jgi:hypothetical protein